MLPVAVTTVLNQRSHYHFNLSTFLKQTVQTHLLKPTTSFKRKSFDLYKTDKYSVERTSTVLIDAYKYNQDLNMISCHKLYLDINTGYISVVLCHKC